MFGIQLSIIDENLVAKIMLKEIKIIDHYKKEFFYFDRS